MTDIGGIGIGSNYGGSGSSDQIQELSNTAYTLATVEGKPLQKATSGVSVSSTGGLSFPPLEIAHLDFGFPFHWLSDVLNGVIDIITYPIRLLAHALTDWLPQAVNFITVKLREAEYHLGQDLKQFYNTTLGYWVTTLLLVGTIAVGIIAGPAIISFFTKGGGASVITALKTHVGSFFAKIPINTFVEINRIAQVLFPKWRDVWTTIYSNIGSIMGDLGYGFGTLAALMTAGKSSLLLFYSAMGMDQDTADTLAYSQMTDYVTGLSNDFNRYAENPQDIWNDFYSKVVLPQSGVVKSQIGDILANVDTVSKRVTALEGLVGSITTFQTTFEKAYGFSAPASIQSVRTEVVSAITDVENKYINPIQDDIKSIHKQIDPLITAQKEHEAQIAAQKAEIAANKQLAERADSFRSSLDSQVVYIQDYESDGVAYLDKSPDLGGDMYLLALLQYARWQWGEISESEYNIYVDNLVLQTGSSITPPTEPV